MIGQRTPGHQLAGSAATGPLLSSPYEPEPQDLGVPEQGPEAVFVASFAEFYNVHHKKIAASLALNFGDVELGREATDEAMTRAFSHWGTVSGHRNPAGWVYRVGLNWGRSWFRRAGRRLPWLDNATAELPETADPALRKALLNLDHKHRAIVVCRYFLDWSTNQTAEALDIPVGTAKSRLHHALALLRAELGEPETEPSAAEPPGTEPPRTEPPRTEPPSTYPQIDRHGTPQPPRTNQ